MKKLVIFIFSLFIVVQVNAFNVDLQENQTFFQGAGIKDVTSINIVIGNDNEITKDKSFSLILPDDANVRFSSDLSNLSLLGVGTSKIIPGAIIMPNLRVIKFKVTDDFKKGDNFTINGVKVIVYTKPQGGRSIGIDTNGDLLADYQSLNTIRVDATYSYSDQLGPNEVLNFTGNIIDNKVTLTADMPGDIDFQGVQIDNLDISGKVVSGFFRNDMNNFNYDLQNGVETIRIKTIDTRANYSIGLLFPVSTLKPIIPVLTFTGTTTTVVTSTGNLSTSTGVTTVSTGITDIIDIPVVPEIFMIDKYLTTFKSATFNAFMFKFDKIIDKKAYREEVRIARNDIIKLLKDYEDKKVSKPLLKTKLKELVIKFVKVYK